MMTPNANADYGKWDLVIPKCYDFRQPKSIGGILRKSNISCLEEGKQENGSNPERTEKVSKDIG